MKTFLNWLLLYIAGLGGLSSVRLAFGLLVTACNALLALLLWSHKIEVSMSQIAGGYLFSMVAIFLILWLCGFRRSKME